MTSAKADAARHALEQLQEYISTLEVALTFYADPMRHDGPNKALLPHDPFTPADAGYRMDVTRDGGAIARKALGL